MKALPMSMVGFPLLLIPLAIFNIIVFLMPGVPFAASVTTVTLMSGVSWTITVGDMLLAIAMLLLLFEVIKAARPGARYLTDHLLSLLVFAAAAAEFLLLPQFGTSTFFLLTVLALVDFLAGVAIRARRDARVATVSAAPAKSARKQAADSMEPHFDPAPVPASPPAVPAPPPAIPAVHSSEAAPHQDAVLNSAPPEVQAPGIQPAAPHPSSDLPPR